MMYFDIPYVSMNTRVGFWCFFYSLKLRQIIKTCVNLVKNS